MIKLHSSLGPNPRLARMFLMEKGLAEGSDFERVHYDIITGENRASADYTAKNPLGTTPTLELEDGTCLTESWPICEYIEELHPPPTSSAKPLLNAPRCESGCACSIRKWSCR